MGKSEEFIVVAVFTFSFYRATVLVAVFSECETKRESDKITTSTSTNDVIRKLVFDVVILRHDTD